MLLKEILGEDALSIEHVGSTSIPGLSSKPILDIAVAVKDEKTLEKLIPVFQQNGYDVLDSIEKCGEILARKGMSNCRTHYIHVEVLNSTYWNNHILFRDYLLKYPKLAQQYENLKRSIADQYKTERKKYTAEKNAFIQHVLNLAKNTKI